MPRRTRPIEDEIDTLEQRHARSSRRIEADIPPHIIAAMDARLDAEAQTWQDEFDAVLARAFKA